MLSTLLKTTILAEDVCCIFACHQWANLLSVGEFVCGGGGGGAFMLSVTEIVIYSHFMGQMAINQSFLWKLSSLAL